MANRKSLMVGASTFALVSFGYQDPTQAQNANQAYVVTTCGTPGITLTAGKYGPVFQNTSGTLCTAGSGGGGGAITAADGAIVTLGTTTDNVASTPASNATATLIALAKAINNNVAAPIPSCNTSGPCTTTIGNIGFDPSSGKGTPTSIPISISTGATAQLVALSGSTKIYVTSFDVIAGGTGTIQFVTGTGTACANGSTTLTGAYPLTAQAGIAKGNGAAAVLITPAGGELCVTTSTSAQMSGSLTYQQF